MALSEADIGYGVKIEIKNAAGVFVDLGEITDFEAPQPETEEKEATHMQSPGGRREFIAGLTDPGEASFETNWIEGSVTDRLLTEMFVATPRPRREVKLTFPGGTIWEFTAWLKAYQPTAPLGDVMKAKCTLRVTGSTEITHPV